MNDEQAQADLEELERSGRKLPLELSPREAWQLLAALQGASQNLALPVAVIGYARQLGLGIEVRLCKTPALKEEAARGWERPSRRPPPDEEQEIDRPNYRLAQPEQESPKPKRRKPQ